MGGGEMKITLDWLKEKSACTEGYKWSVKHLEKYPDGQEWIEFVQALINDKKLDWANWVVVRIMTYKQYVSYAVFAAEQVLGIFEKKYPNDDRPRKAIEAAKKCIDNPSKRNKAAADADAAAADADAAAAYAAADAAAYAAADDAYAAAYAAANAAADADAAAAAAAAADAAAYDVRNKMKQKILNYGIGLLRERGRT
jgi:hypothetical protein